MPSKTCIFALLICGLLSGCSSLSTTNRTLASAQSQGFQKQVIDAPPFKLTSYTKFSNQEPILHVYLEGDGHAWNSRTRVSDNPTPHQPVALVLALQDTHSNVAYLARPCQYTPLNEDIHCDAKYWTSHRFSPEVIASLNTAINLLKTQSDARELYLIGFSGGGGLAALITARRNDVIKLITVAGDLDHKALTAFHHTTPMPDSLNAIDDVEQLKNIRQIHFSGEKDNVVPPFIAERFIAKLNHPTCAKQIIAPEATHNKGWEKGWGNKIENLPC